MDVDLGQRNPLGRSESAHGGVAHIKGENMIQRRRPQEKLPTAAKTDGHDEEREEWRWRPEPACKESGE